MQDKIYIYKVLIFFFALLFFVLSYSVVYGQLSAGAEITGITFSTLDNFESMQLESQSLMRADWLVKGEVQITEDEIQISGPDNSNSWRENSIELEVSASEAAEQVISFEYLINSSEYLEGFDQLAMVVMLDDKIIAYEDFFPKEEWKKLEFLVGSFVGDATPSTHNLKIFAGNSGDSWFSSWVTIKNMELKLVGSIISMPANIEEEIVASVIGDKILLETPQINTPSPFVLINLMDSNNGVLMELPDSFTGEILPQKTTLPLKKYFWASSSSTTDIGSEFTLRITDLFGNKSEIQINSLQ